MSGPNLQRTFDFPRAAKLNALERVEYLGNVKGALKALDAFARDAASCTVTMKMIARSMGKSINTARRAIRAAVEANLLRVSGQCTDGCSNTYTVNWSVVFSLPDGVRKQKRKSTQTPTKPALVPPPNLGGVSDTDTTDKETDTERKSETPEDGGGKLEIEKKQKSGAWAGAIDKDTLGRKEDLKTIRQAAVLAGLLTNDRSDVIRFYAAAYDARQRPAAFVGGHLINRIESASWHLLSDKGVSHAVRRLFPNSRPPTPAEIKQIKSIRSRNETAEPVGIGGIVTGYQI